MVRSLLLATAELISLALFIGSVALWAYGLSALA
jgi:hypothetical protein